MPKLFNEDGSFNQEGNLLYAHIHPIILDIFKKFENEFLFHEIEYAIMGQASSVASHGRLIQRLNKEKG